MQISNGQKEVLDKFGYESATEKKSRGQCRVRGSYIELISSSLLLGSYIELISSLQNM